MNKTWIVVVVLLVLLGAWGWMGYNNFVSLGLTVDKQWSQVENQFQRRFDLIPNLVASVQGQMKQEQAVFGAIAEARTKYGGATTVNEKAAAASQVESALGRLLVVMENYPQLKTDTVVVRLMDELSGTENRIAVERERFNTAVTAYNGAVMRFPGMILAKVFGFGPRELFKAAEGAEVAPKVQL